MLSTLAMYLPQFHRTPENDEWWGEGFTEWTAVRGAESLYEDHNQPRVPLNKKYYNLLEHDTMAWQADLMKKYHIDGMCIYHYWFEGGKRILEKPIENLLEWNDISMPFCFCWANETWSRTWKKLSDANVWSSLYESKNGYASNGILLKQSYGRERDWEEHFKYLLSFFKDERYIKLDGKPVFTILKPSKIYSLWNMMRLFDHLAKENGFPGLYVIGMEENQQDGLDGVCIKQPGYAMERCKIVQHPLCKTLYTYSYKEVWKNIQKDKVRDNKTYFCGFVDYDSSPRMGKSGQVMENVSLETFYENFRELYKKSRLLNNEFIFVNAWNEWGEGMYLEPDEKNGYGYLEAISNIVIESKNDNLIISKGSEKKLHETKMEEIQRKERERVQIWRRHDALLDDWMHLRDLSIDFSHYFHKYGYRNIAIYGMGKLGTHLLYELRKGDITVSFGIDQNAGGQTYLIDVYSPKQKMPQVDAVVITIIGKYGEISKILSQNLKCSMIPIEELIQELISEK